MRRSIKIRGVLCTPIDFEKLAQAIVAAAQAQRKSAEAAAREIDEQPSEKAS